MNDSEKKVLINFLKLLLNIFLHPVWFMLAWNGWAWAFNLPQFGYWHWVVTYTAIKCIGMAFSKGK